MTLQELNEDIIEWDKQDVIFHSLFHDPNKQGECDAAFQKVVILERKYEELFHENKISTGGGDFVDFLRVSAAMYRLID